MSRFIVKQPGLLTLIQDRGRYGAHNLGLTNGGPLDPLSFDWANRLLANDINDTCLEVSFGGLTLE
jgi:allophanate hydrolase subunit 2